MDEQPIIITTTVEYLNGMFGFGKKVNASLYRDRIDLWQGNQLVYQLKLSDIDSVKYPMGGGVLRFKLKDSKMLVINFVVMPWRLLGLLGYYISGGVDNSKLWRYKLAELGVAQTTGVF